MVDADAARLRARLLTSEGDWGPDEQARVALVCADLCSRRCFHGADATLVVAEQHTLGIFEAAAAAEESESEGCDGSGLALAHCRRGQELQATVSAEGKTQGGAAYMHYLAAHTQWQKGDLNSAKASVSLCDE